MILSGSQHATNLPFARHYFRFAAYAGYDGRADIWSLGIILYELVSFTRPFHGENIAQLAMAITRKQPKGAVHYCPPKD